MSKEIKVGIYGRVSTRDKQNPESQLEPCRDHCRGKGWTWKEYVDRASGTTLNRPGFKQLQYDIHHRHINLVVCYAIDRLGRTMHDLVMILADWSVREVELVSVTQAIDTTTPLGRAFYYWWGIVAETERELIVERVNSGLDRARRQGVKLGRPKTKVTIPPDVLAALSEGKMSLYMAAKTSGIPRNTLRRRLAARGQKSMSKRLGSANKVDKGE